MKCPLSILIALVAVAMSGRADVQPAAPLVVYLDDTPSGPRIVADLRIALEKKARAAAKTARITLVVVDLANKEVLREALARELRKGPAAIVAANSNVAVVAQSLTRDVPVVFASREDPVRMGFARSLGRPGGNLTGFTYFVPIDAKRLELLRELAPRARKLGVIIDRWWLDESGGQAVVRTAREQFGFETELFEVESPSELKRALATPRAKSVDAWYVPLTWLPYQQPQTVVAAINAMRRPAVFPAARFVESGGLVSYGELLSTHEAVSLLAAALALVLDGVAPAQIPIERPKAFELAVNVAAARELGLRIPDALLKRADRVVAP